MRFHQRSITNQALSASLTDVSRETITEIGNSDRKRQKKGELIAWALRTNQPACTLKYLKYHHLRHLNLFLNPRGTPEPQGRNKEDMIMTKLPLPY